MLKQALVEIFERDLNKLKDEINLYASEEQLWRVENQISNSAGNLCLHLIGNLNHFVGTILGETDYVRDRDSEFASKNVTKTDLIRKIEQTIETVKIVLNDLPDGNFDRDFPVEKHGDTVKTDFMLLHLLTHFNYHLGQINYHRRLLS